MADVSLELLDYFNTWDVLGLDVGGLDVSDVGYNTSFHGVEATRDLLDMSGDNPRDVQTMYGTADTHAHHDPIDSTHHQHLNDVIDDERHPRRKSHPRILDIQEATRRKQKLAVLPWTMKNTYIFLLFWNFIMLTLYTTNNFLFVPRSVWYIVVLLHVSAISIYVYDTANYLLLGKKGACKPTPIHIV